MTAGGRRRHAGVEVAGLGRVFAAGKRLGRRDHRRRDVVALTDVSLTVEEGELHGLLGPNGAGKTTLVKILSTVLLPTTGRASVAGWDVVADPAAVRPHIGIVFGGDLGLYNRLTARQNLRYWAALYRMAEVRARSRVEELLERLGLAARADDRVETYSRGMKQRLHLARGLIADPSVLFLDEPSVGLDPVAARDVRALIAELRQEGRTILLTTHDMAEAEDLCDRVTLVDRGRVLATETPATLARWMSRYERIDVQDAPTPLLDELADLPGVASLTPTTPGTVRIEVVEEQATEKVLSRLVADGVTSIRTGRPSLEEIYVHLVGDRGLEV